MQPFFFLPFSTRHGRKDDAAMRVAFFSFFFHSPFFFEARTSPQTKSEGSETCSPLPFLSPAGLGVAVRNGNRYLLPSPSPLLKSPRRISSFPFSRRRRGRITRRIFLFLFLLDIERKVEIFPVILSSFSEDARFEQGNMSTAGFFSPSFCFFFLYKGRKGW